MQSTAQHVPPQTPALSSRVVHRRLSLVWVGVLASFLVLAVVLTYESVPSSNFSGQPLDVLLVLGSPATSSGAMTPMQYWRVHEAVSEYRQHRASHILFTGGAAANRFVESEVMKAGAIQMGVPADAIATETASQTTLENIANSRSILAARHWQRVEVISSPEHLHRAAVLLQPTGLLWTVHASPTSFRPWCKSAIAYTSEAAATTIVRWFGPKTAPYIHEVAKWFNRYVLQVRLAWKAAH